MYYNQIIVDNNIYLCYHFHIKDSKNMLSKWIRKVLKRITKSTILKSNVLINGIPIILFFITAFRPLELNAYHFYFPYFKILFLSFIIALVLVCIRLFTKSTRLICINLTDLLIALFAVYTLISLQLTPYGIYYHDEIILIILSIVMYFILKFNVAEFEKKDLFSFFLILLVFINLREFIITTLQFFGKITYLDPRFSFGGSFINPGQLGTMSALSLNILFGSLILIKRESKILQSILITGVVFSTILVIISDSRTSWLITVIGSIYLFSRSDHAERIFKLIRLKYRRTVLFFRFTLLILLVVGLFLLYKYREDSANSRIFNAKVCLSIIKDKPLLGHGFGSYQFNKARYQIKYFKDKPEDIKNGMLAGDGAFACNDILEWTTELGVIGILILLSLILTAFLIPKKNNIQKIVTAGLLGYLIALSLSYPLSDPTHLFFLFILLFFANNRFINLVNLKGLMKDVFHYLILLGLLIGSIVEFPRYIAVREWQRTYFKVEENSSDFNKYIDKYESLYKLLKNNPYFLYNYGYNLYAHSNKYLKSINLLEQSEVKVPSMNLYIILGRLNEFEGNNKSAINYYLMASNLVPHLFTPKYYLLLLYENQDMLEEAIATSKEIVNMNTKIFGAEEARIRAYALNFLNKYKAGH
jgi:O-antigen ligase